MFYVEGSVCLLFPFPLLILLFLLLFRFLLLIVLLLLSFSLSMISDEIQGWCSRLALRPAGTLLSGVALIFATQTNELYGMVGGRTRKKKRGGKKTFIALVATPGRLRSFVVRDLPSIQAKMKEEQKHLAPPSKPPTLNEYLGLNMVDEVGWLNVLFQVHPK